MKKNNAIIFGTPRSGSTYVQALIAPYWEKKYLVKCKKETELFNKYKEYLGPYKDRLRVINRVIKLHTWATPNDIIEQVLGNRRDCIAVEREDLYEQFVSWLIARTTGQWFLSEGEEKKLPDAKIDIETGLLEQYTDTIARYERLTKQWALPIIRYEHAIEDLKALYPDWEPPEDIGLVKQNDDSRYQYVSDDLRERFDMMLSKSRNKGLPDWGDEVDDGITCAAPWVHMYIEPNGQVHPCCTTIPVVYGNTNNNSLEEIWNSDAAVEFRDKLLRGEKQEVCKFCYDQESHTTVMSLRQWLNSKYRGDILGTKPEFKLKYVDIRASNICNFACVMCGEQLSSNWYDDKVKMLGAEKVGLEYPKFIQLTEKTKNELIAKIDDVEQLYWAGGEPLITEFHYDILDELLQRDMHDILLRYNTNLSKLTYKRKNILDYWKQFKRVQLAASVDLHGERGEYQRYGLVWQEFVDNWNTIKNELPHVQMSLQITITALTIGYLPEFCEEIKNTLGIETFAYNFTHGPMHYNPQVLPIYAKQEYTKKLEDYAKLDTTPRFFREFCWGAIKFMHAKHHGSDRWWRAKEYWDKLDEIRGNSWRKLWPELEKDYGE